MFFAEAVPVVWIVMGVSGSGKTRVGRTLAERLGCPFHDADDFHPAANREKMARGEPLTEADRAPWLGALREAIVGWERAGGTRVLACSALRQAYRDVLTGKPADGAGDPAVQFIYLKGDPALLAGRLAGRTGHFFNPALLQTQLATLEEPRDAALTVDVAQSPENIVTEIVQRLGLRDGC